MTTKTIKLLITDIDGCLIQGEKAAYDFAALSLIRQINQAATADNVIPYVTICSGRPYPYVEAMLKLIGGRWPAVFEHGCGLYFPRRELHRECVYHPAARFDGRQRRQWEELVSHIIRETGAGRQCAKGALVTLFSPPEQSAADLAHYVAGQIAEAGLPLAVGHTVTSVDVTPRGIDKGSGVRWLLEELQAEGWTLTLDQVAAVGDSSSDICFMKPAGFSAAPDNAVPAVKTIADYVSPQRYTRGLLDILEKVIRRNEAFGT